MGNAVTAPDPRSLRRGLAWTAASLGCGLALALSLPPVNAVVLVWLSLAGFACVLGVDLQPSGAGRVRRVFEGAARGLAFGIGMNAGSLRFLPGVITRFAGLPLAAGLVALLLVGAVQGTVWAALAMIRARLVLWRLPPWLAFAVAGFASAFVPTVFPWTPAGLLTPWPSVVQLADVIGEHGIAFLTFLSAGLLADAARMSANRGWRARPVLTVAAIALGLPLAQAAYGAVRIGSVEAFRATFPTARVGLVSPAFDALERWNSDEAPALLRRLNVLTREAEAKGAQLTVWTEAAHPFALGHGRLTGPAGPYAILQPGTHGPVLLGALTLPEAGDAFNSALVAYPDGTVSDSYDKMHLLWFGETVPFGEWIPWLKHTFMRGTGLSAGVHNSVLPAGPVHAGVLICYEDTLTSAGREAAAGGPNLLVNLTNDAWFSGSWESDNQLRLAAMRAVETRRDLVRSVNGGPTSWVDAAGVIRARHENVEASVLLVEPALIEAGPTFYVRVGDLPLVVALGALVWTLRRRARSAAAVPR
jgi:apolipoprotein N-acyltransferase